MKSRLFVGSLAKEVKEEELTQLFSQHGKVIAVEIIKDWDSGKSRGFGFVQMESDTAAAEAIEKLHGQQLHNRKLRVLVAKTKDETGDSDQRQQKSERSHSEDIEPTSAKTETPESKLAGSKADPVETASVEAASVDAAADKPQPTPTTQSTRSRKLWGLALLAAIAVALGLWLSQRPQPVQGDPNTVLVMPMEIYGQEEGADYLGYAFSQALAVNLAPAKNFKVLPVPQVSEVQGTSSDKAAASALQRGAGRLLIGSLTRKAESVQVSLTLVDAEQNRIMWGTQKQGQDQEIMDLASEIAGQVVKQLGTSLPQHFPYITDLTGPPGMAASPSTAQVVAALRLGDIDRAMEATASLLQAFPNTAEALALRTHALVLQWDAKPTQANLELLQKSLAVLENSGKGYPYSDFYRAYLAYAEAHQPQQAIGLYSKILEHDNLAPAARAWMLRYRGLAKIQTKDVKGALSDLNDSLLLAPTNAWTLGILSGALVDAGKLQQALQRAQQGMALLPSYWRSHHGMAYVLSAQGHLHQAAQSYEKACQLGSSQLTCSLFALTLFRIDKPDQANAAAQKAETLPEDPWGTYNLACLQALRGQQEQALRLLQRAAELGLQDETIRTDKDLDGLRQLPQFNSLQAKISSVP